VGYDNIKIRDLSRPPNEWTPPISALGGPPAHELYVDLVMHAGLRVFRDSKSRPWVVLQDGAQRRAFPAPSAGLRSALDRFRMRRNLRPAPEGDIDEFVRIVEARTSDPDIAIPTLRLPVGDSGAMHEWHTSMLPSDPTESLSDGSSRLVERADPEAGRPEEAVLEVPTTPHAPPAPVAPRWEGLGPELTAPPVRASISGGRSLPADSGPGFARYLRLFRELIRESDWMGTTEELSQLTHDDPFSMFDSLLRYRNQLIENDILIANVEVGGTYRWLAVDRGRIRNGHEAQPRVEPSPIPS
jgi:hypothetical protein